MPFKAASFSEPDRYLHKVLGTLFDLLGYYWMILLPNEMIRVLCTILGPL